MSAQINSQITVVRFKAFDKFATETFYDKTPEEIHAELENKCNSYQPVGILKGVVTSVEPLSMLTQFPKNESERRD